LAATVNVDVEDASGCDTVPSDADCARWVTLALTEAGHTGDAVDTVVSVRVVGQDESRQLNKSFRDIDRATNVLSFPVDVEMLFAVPPGEPRPLGDIVICADIVAQEAAQQSKRVEDHWAHLLIHGALHLVGFDHTNDQDAQAMEGSERRVLAALGIANPYATS